MPESGALLDAMAVPRDAFRGRAALVTGGARGLGEATARQLAERGAAVAIVDILPLGERVASELRANGARAMFLACDVADAERFQAVLAEAGRVLGPIDVFVHAAVQVEFGRCGDIALADFDRAHAVNARAPFVALQALLPAMLHQRRGVAVNMAVLERGPFGSALGTSKAAARMLFATVARELEHDAGVSLFSFLPGVVDTPGFRREVVPRVARCLGLTEDAALAMLARNPGHDGLLPVDHAAAALVYLLARAPEYHGQLADPFEPLARHGLIGSTSDASQAAADWMRTFAEVNAHNRDLEERIRLRTEELAEAHARSESLLLNILPRPIAERLKASPEPIADAFEDVSVVFADLVGFTPMSAAMPPTALVGVLDEVFRELDELARRAGLEKIKTIGDCYMVVGGLPEPRDDHLAASARAALAFVEAVRAVGDRVGVPLACRVGIHVGPVVAGVIGKQKFSYDLWGDTVNTASRMESHGAPGHVLCTAEVKARLEAQFAFVERGRIEVKGKGTLDTYWLVGER